MSNKMILDGHKLKWHMDRVKKLMEGERVAPITLDCAITTQCNYKCAYCYGELQRINTEPHLSEEVVFSFLEDAAAIGVKAISFVSDGESTCNPCLSNAIVFGKKLGMDMALGTNGFLLNESQLNQILPALTYLRFNISAGEAHRYAHIHGVAETAFDVVCDNISKAVKIKRDKNLEVTIGLQMVLMPEFEDQIIPLAKLGEKLDVDYLVLKHCSDDENGSIGVGYKEYNKMYDLLKLAESMSTEKYLVKVKWSKLLDEGKRKYSKCYGPPLLLQISGSGIVAPCGSFFNDKYKKFHIGNIKETRFKEIWNSDRYWEVMDLISSESFNAHTDCGTLCLQHKVNEYLWDLKNMSEDEREIQLAKEIPEAEVQHINFI